MSERNPYQAPTEDSYSDRPQAEKKSSHRGVLVVTGSLLLLIGLALGATTYVPPRPLGTILAEVCAYVGALGCFVQAYRS